MKQVSAISLIALPLLFTACGVNNSASQLDSSSVSGGISARLELGQAYDADRAQWGNLACVTGKVVNDLGSSGQLEYRQDMSFEDTLKELSGELEIGVNFPSVAVDGKADYAARNSSSEFREVHSLVYKYKTRSKLETGSHQLTELGKKYAADPLRARDRCKDEFVNEIVYGASYMANLSVEFKSKEDKEKFGGSLKVKVLEGKVEVSGKLAAASDEEKRSVKIRLNAMQEGGDPRKLSAILTPDIASCDVSNLDKCLEGFRALIQYGNQMPEQIKSTNELVVLSYNTEAYRDTGFDELAGEDEADMDVLETRFNLEKELETVRQQIARADFLVANYAASLNETQQAQMPEARANLKMNKMYLTKALEFCYKNPYLVEGADGRSMNPCVDNAVKAEQKLKVIPSDIFNIPTRPTTPTGPNNPGGGIIIATE